MIFHSYVNVYQRVFAGIFGATKVDCSNEPGIEATVRSGGDEPSRSKTGSMVLRQICCAMDPIFIYPSHVSIYPLVMTNSLPWYRWPISRWFTYKKMGGFSMVYILSHLAGGGFFLMLGIIWNNIWDNPSHWLLHHQLSWDFTTVVPHS